MAVILLVLCPAALAEVPAAPSGLAAWIIDSRRVLLRWQDNSNNERSFRLERAPSPAGPWMRAGQVKADNVQKVVGRLQPSITYYFRIAALNREGSSAYSEVLSVRTLAAPSHLVAEPVASNQVSLAWTDNAANETSFSIERASSSRGPWNEIAVVGGDVTTFVDKGIQPGAKQYYRVRACIGCALKQ